jgi:hypothetical protein
MKVVYHTKFTQVIAGVCGVLFAAILIGGIYATVGLTLIYFGLIDSKLHANEWILLIIYISFLYLLRVIFLFWRFAKTIKGKLEYTSAGVIFELDGNKTTFEWKDLTKSKEHADCQIFVLLNDKREHIFTIWELANGYKDFRNAFTESKGT